MSQTFLEVAGIGFEASLFPAGEEIKRTGLLSTVRGVLLGLVSLFTFKPPGSKSPSMRKKCAHTMLSR